MKTGYSSEPQDKAAYTKRMDEKIYSRWAKWYDLFVKTVPIWRNWLKKALPHVKGQRVLEVSFGTGYLLAQLAKDYEVWGVDYNCKMLGIASKNLEKDNLKAHLAQGNVENLPFGDGFFDSLVNTMAFSGYPDANKALSEMLRVLKPGGRLVIMDFDYPANRNWLGCQLVKIMENSGDIIRNYRHLFHARGLDFTHETVGGFGSVHLFVIEKKYE